MLRIFSRKGQTVPVYSEQAGSENDFGQGTTTWTRRGSVLAYRSYQNRNTSRQNEVGELHRDRGVFFFPLEDAPKADHRIKYEGQWYELDAVTYHETHAVAPASKILDDFNP